MKKFYLLFVFMLFVSAESVAANWPGAGTNLGSYDPTPANNTVTGVATNSYISIGVDAGENWTITLSSGEISIFAGPGVPAPGAAPLSTTTSGSVSLSTGSPGVGTFYVLFTWVGPPNRTVTITGSGPLPVTWLSINAQQNDSNVLISWSTASETNNNYFTVERSKNGREWGKIGDVNGAGNSMAEKFYEYVDKKPYTGINYYRIKQTDFDSESNYSAVTSIKAEAVNEVQIQAQQGNITITSSSEDAVDIAIYELSGTLIQNKKIYFYDEIPIPRTGMYIAKINGTTTKKVVVP